MTFASRRRESRASLLTSPSSREGRRAHASSTDDEKRFQNDSKIVGGSPIGGKIKGIEDGRMSHMIFADNCYLFAENKNSDAEDDWGRY